MSVSTSASLWTLLSLWVLVSASEVTITIPDDPGQTVTLPCQAPRDTKIIVVEWTRTDLEPDSVFLQRGSQPVTDKQHPSFQNRVELVDRQMEDGDVSVILKNVTREDRGRYECRVVQRETNRRKRSTLKTDPISIIDLTEAHIGGHSGGHVGLAAGLSVVAVVALVVALGIFMSKRLLKKNPPPPAAADEEAGEQML